MEQQACIIEEADEQEEPNQGQETERVSVKFTLVNTGTNFARRFAA